MARIAVDTGAMRGAGASIASSASDLGGARRAFARVAEAAGDAGDRVVPAAAQAGPRPS